MGLAEMAFAGELGANIDLQHVPRDMDELLVEERRIAGVCRIQFAIRVRGAGRTLPAI